MHPTTQPTKTNYIKRYFEMRRFRKTIREGDTVCISKTHVVEVRIVDKAADEITIWDPMIREYETYPTNHIYPCQQPQSKTF